METAQTFALRWALINMIIAEIEYTCKLLEQRRGAIQSGLYFFGENVFGKKSTGVTVF